MSTTQILVVEDERLVATAIQNELEHFGYQVSGIASSAKEAVEKTIEYKPDLVLMDIHLKGEADGIDAARKIHSFCHVPIVYLSAFSDPETVSRASQTHAFGYLLKPYEERELQTTIEMAIAKHRAEQKLEKTERWLAAIHNAIGEAVIAIDPDNRIRYMNPAAESLADWWQPDAISQPVGAVCRLVDENQHPLLEPLIGRVLRENLSEDLPPMTQFISRKGRTTPVEGALSAIFDSRGEYLGIALVLRDISTRLELESLQQQHEQRQRTAQKLQAVGRLAGGLSQNLNNLLTAILSDTSLAMASLPDHIVGHKLLQQVELAAQRGAQLVQRLQIFSHFSCPPTSHLRSSDFGRLITNCLHDISSRLNANVSLAYKPASDLWPVTADELLFGQALLELVLNAQEAMPQGGHVTIELHNVELTLDDLKDRPDATPGRFVRLRVSDAGEGMAAAVHARIFEPFFTTKASSQSVGLGLTLVRAVVEHHHGWVECHTVECRGTHFDLYLPRKSELAPALGDEFSRGPSVDVG